MDNISGSTLVDESPNNIDANIVGSTSVAGQIGNALTMGTGRYVTNNDTQTTDSAGSFSFWHFSNTLGVDNRVFTAITSSAPDTVAYHVRTDNRIRLFTNDGTTSKQGFSTSTIPLQQWTHIVCTVSASGDLKMYFDSVEETVTTDNTGHFWMADLVREFTDIGRFWNGTTQLNEGDFRLDQFRQFNRVLTQLEVDELFNSGVGA
jgi:hypothetical protein